MMTKKKNQIQTFLSIFFSQLIDEWNVKYPLKFQNSSNTPLKFGNRQIATWSYKMSIKYRHSSVNSVYIDDMSLNQQHSMLFQQQQNPPQLKQNPTKQNCKLIQKPNLFTTNFNVIMFLSRFSFSNPSYRTSHNTGFMCFWSLTGGCHILR
jgi:hypothetical protein